MTRKYMSTALDLVDRLVGPDDIHQHGRAASSRVRMTAIAADHWLTDLVEAHPELDSTGYGRDCGKVPGDRASLARDVDGVLRSLAWLAVQGWAQGGADHYASTYTLKHRAERATGAYISNGAMCAAALLLRPAGLKVDLDGARRNPVVGVLLDR